MTAIATHTRITPDELAHRPDADKFELVNGELVERHVSIRASRVEVKISKLLDLEASRTKEAEVFANSLGYQCYPQDPGQIRKPDVSVVRVSRMTGIDPDRGYMPVPADLVVEVVSPNDLSYEVMSKVDEYLEAGFPLIWVVHPNVRTVSVYAKGRPSPILLRDDDEITAEPALAGFRCKVAAFFE